MRLTGLQNLFYNRVNYDYIKTLLERKIKLPKKYKNFELNENGDLILQPEGLIVIPRENTQEVLKNLFETDPNVVGKGINGLYKYLASRYIGFTRETVSNFIKQRASYQLTANANKVVNKPIIETQPNKRYQIDLIDLTRYENHNYGYKYILNCVDVFTRFAWLRRLKNKTPDDVLAAFQSIVEEANTLPDRVQNDNGTEFLGSFQEYLKEQGIKQIFNKTYTPNSNALVERSNQVVQKVLRAFFIENNNLKWYNILDKVQDNLNNTYNGTIRTLPVKVWTEGKEADEDNELKNNAIDNIKRIAKNKLSKYKDQDNFKEGDMVRVKMSAIFSQIRKLIKSKESKNIVVAFTPLIFEITKKVYRGGATYERNRYILQGQNGEPIRKKNGEIAQFYASDIIHADDVKKDVTLSMDRALKLNGVERTINDLQYE
jgi:hypothetical protein